MAPSIDYSDITYPAAKTYNVYFGYVGSLIDVSSPQKNIRIDDNNFYNIDPNDIETSTISNNSVFNIYNYTNNPVTIYLASIIAKDNQWQGGYHINIMSIAPASISSSNDLIAAVFAAEIVRVIQILYMEQ